MTKFISILGKPIAQKRHRFGRNGIVYNPSAKDKKNVIYEVVNQFREKPFDNAVLMEINFYCPRPKSHYGTGRNKEVLKPSAPKHKITKADLDNLVKFYLDCMNKICYNDDSQVISILASKNFTGEYQEPYTEIVITDFK